MESYNARWVVHGFVEISNAHYNPLAIRSPDASDPPLLILLCLSMRYSLYLKPMDDKTVSLS